ncbi:MAG: alanyl-tRNA editing protein [Thermoplasmataceae archaeon]
MTEKLFWKDMYLINFDAKVVGLDGNIVYLDKTAFYPTGGGQPFDTGIIESGSKRYNVTNVEKNGDEVAHTLNEAPDMAIGDIVKGAINWDRRYAHMRYHSAIHVIDGVFARMHSEEGFLTGGQIYQDRARIDIDMAEYSREAVENIIEQCNNFIREGHRIYSKFLTRNEAAKIENLSRTAPGRELLTKLDSVRVIVIEGLDEQADGGTHVRNTREIGEIKIRKIENKGKRNKRIDFVLEGIKDGTGP